MSTMTGKDAPAARPPFGASLRQRHHRRVPDRPDAGSKTLPTWWRMCFDRQFEYIPAASFVTGRWSLGKAKRDEIEHAQMVERPLAKVHAKEA